MHYNTIRRTPTYDKDEKDKLDWDLWSSIITVAATINLRSSDNFIKFIGWCYERNWIWDEVETMKSSGRPVDSMVTLAMHA